MPKSHKRGGVKAHNRRVKARNERIAGERKRLQQAYTEMLQQKMEEFQKEYSGVTEETSITPEIVETELVMEGNTTDVEATVVTDEQN